MRRALGPTCRLYSTPSASNTTHLLSILQRNSELTATDAQNELRWLRQASNGVEPARRDGALEILVQRRGAGEPLQYILGDTDFGPLTLLTRAPVLIPRPETAYIVEKLSSMLPKQSRPLKVLDLCTGSGCIPLLLAHLREVSAWGVDINPEAILLANDNKALLVDRDLLRGRVDFFEADIFAPSFVATIEEKVRGVDLITANPPYIPREEYDALPPSVRRWEDERALLAEDVGGSPGVAFYARIAELAREILKLREGREEIRLAVEIGATQGKAVSDLLPGKTEVVQDQWGRDRMVIASF